MAQPQALLPLQQTSVLEKNGFFTTIWYLFFQFLALDIVQVGDCIVLAGAIRVPYLKCDGSAVSRTKYAALFAAIGTTYGPGDGVTTFNLPNFPTPGAPSFWAIHYQ